MRLAPHLALLGLGAASAFVENEGLNCHIHCQLDGVSGTCAA